MVGTDRRHPSIVASEHRCERLREAAESLPEPGRAAVEVLIRRGLSPAEVFNLEMHIRKWVNSVQELGGAMRYLGVDWLPPGFVPPRAT